MTETDTLIVGASIAGLAAAAALQKKQVDYLIIEKEGQTAMPWRNHNERLHLHTSKNLSGLPYKKFDSAIPRYPSRQQVVDYLEGYQQAFGIHPIFHTEARSIEREHDYWITETNQGVFKSRCVVIATGVYGKPRMVDFRGMASFTGKILHSYGYKSGRDFKGQKVLVIGFGNSACEIAIDLYEQSAVPGMSVRSAVNIIPRDLFGIPILQISLLMSKLPAKLADVITAPLLRLLFGDTSKLGLKKKRYGPFQQIQKERTIPLLDIGTIQHIRKGHIRVFDDISYIEGNTVYFVDGKAAPFDAIVMATGYYRDVANIVRVDAFRFEDLKLPVSKQHYFGKDGLYFCGFWVAPTGQFREIGLDAKRIAADVAGGGSKR